MWAIQGLDASEGGWEGRLKSGMKTQFVRFNPVLVRAIAGATSTCCRHVPCRSPVLGLGIRRSGVIGIAFGVLDGEGRELDRGSWVGG